MTNHTRFESIDVLRGFAAISVVVYHTIEHLNWTAFPTTSPLVWFRIGGMGVDLFFVISGFVISLTAFDGIDKHGPHGFRRPFAENRLRRIVPLYLLTAVLWVLMVQPQRMLQSDFLQQVLAHVFFVHNLSPVTRGAIDGPNWSVGTEMQFYLLILLIAPLLRRTPAVVILIAGVGISWIWRALVFRYVDSDASVATHHLFVYTTQLPGTLDHFAFGILLAHVIRSPRGQRLLLHLQSFPLLPAAGAAIVVWFTLAVFWANPNYWQSVEMVTLFRTMLSVAGAAVIFAACCFNGPWSRWLTAPLRYLGTISYGIYLWHMLVLVPLKERVAGISPEIGLFIVLSATLLLAAGSWHFFERPLMTRRTSVSPNKKLVEKLVEAAVAPAA